MSSSRARSTLLVAPALIVAAAVATLAAGCGDPPVRVESRTLRVRLDEYRITPQDVVVKPGRLRLEAHNAGVLTHNLRIVQPDPKDREKPPIELAGTETAQPGETVTRNVTLAPGEYEMICSIANHDDLGMHGRLIVSAKGR